MLPSTNVQELRRYVAGVGVSVSFEVALVAELKDEVLSPIVDMRHQAAGGQIPNLQHG